MRGLRADADAEDSDGEADTAEEDGEVFMPGLALLQPSLGALSTIRPGIVHRLDKGTTGEA